MSLRAWEKFSETVEAGKDQPAVLHGDAKISFADLEASAQNWATTIAAPAGERVILCGQNSIAIIGAVLGIWRTGAIPVWVNDAAPLSHIQLAQEETQAVCVVSDKTELAEKLPCRVINEAISGSGALPPAGQNEIGSIVYTSGSTGRPKGVIQKAETLIDGAARVAAALGYQGGDRILCPVPFAFDYGWGQLLSLLFQRMTLVLPSPNNAFGVCHAITQHKPTIFAGVPAVFSNLMSGLSPIRETDCSSIRLITNTGSRIPKNVLESLFEVFPHADLSLNYGLTETYRTATLPISLAKSKPHSVGNALTGAEIVILDKDGRLCAPHETGQIVHRGAGVFEGYWRNPEQTAKTLRPDPIAPTSGRKAVFTGDLGFLDDQGHLVIVGRADRQIKSMGVRVSPDEIEDILLTTGHMAEAAITSRPDEMTGELVVAFVVARPGADAEADLKNLKRDVRTKLSPYMTPRIYQILDALPRNSNGKVDYPALKNLAMATLH